MVGGRDQALDGSGTAAEFTLVVDAAAGGRIEVALGDFILKASYQRQGADLLLEGADGTKVLIQGYFDSIDPADLVTGNGSVVSGATVVRLAGPPAPAQYAQAGTAQGAEPIGTVETADGQASVVRAAGARQLLEPGDSVFQGDVVETGTALLHEPAHRVVTLVGREQLDAARAGTQFQHGNGHPIGGHVLGVLERQAEQVAPESDDLVVSRNRDTEVRESGRHRRS